MTFYSLNLKCALNTDKSSKMLFNIALIYGCYSGMQVRSLRIGFKIFDGDINENQIINFFEYVFTKYKVPNILVNNIDRIDDVKTLELLLDLLRGKNLKELNFVLS